MPGHGRSVRARSPAAPQPAAGPEVERPGHGRGRLTRIQGRTLKFPATRAARIMTDRAGTRSPSPWPAPSRTELGGPSLPIRAGCRHASDHDARLYTSCVTGPGTSRLTVRVTSSRVGRCPPARGHTGTGTLALTIRWSESAAVERKQSSRSTCRLDPGATAQHCQSASDLGCGPGLGQPEPESQPESSSMSLLQVWRMQ